MPFVLYDLATLQKSHSLITIYKLVIGPFIAFVFLEWTMLFTSLNPKHSAENRRLYNNSNNNNNNVTSNKIL